MHRTHGWLMLAGLAIVSAVGCSASNAITRGQSPSAIRPASHQLHAAPCTDGCHFGAHPGGGCPVEGGWQSCHDGGCGSCWSWHNLFGCGGWDGGWSAPKYEVPDDLAYPPAHVPPSFVQYPYYTVRGPTDFFLQ